LRSGVRLRVVYLPKHNLADSELLSQMLSGIRAADLVSATASGPYATFLPLIYDPTSAPAGALLGHVARRNDHWRLETIGESMVIVHGPDAYVSPGWYASKREHGRVVPTWNYTIAHVYGELLVHDDPVWLEDVVRRLTERHERDRSPGWSVDDAPRDYVDGQLQAIVGLELRISRVQAKAKLGQGRSAADLDGVIAGLNDHDALIHAGDARAPAELAELTATRARRDA